MVPTLDELNPIFQIVFFTNFIPFILLGGPIAYFYFRFQVMGSHFSLRRDYLHLLPCLIATVNMIPFYFSDLDSKKLLINHVVQDYHHIFEINFLWFSSAYYYLVSPIYTLIYLVVCILYIDANFPKIEEEYEGKELTNVHKWLKYLIIYFAIIIVLNIIIVYYSYFSLNKPEILIYLAQLVAIALFNIEIYNFPQILYGIKFTANSHESKTVFIKKAGKKIMIDHDFIQQYEQKMLEYQENLTFLGPTISVQQLAEDLNSPKYRVDYYIKNELKSNFAEIKNRYRIEYFIKSFHPSDLEKYTLDAIVKTYGFSNTQTFKREFAKVYNENFTDYLKKI